MVSLHCNATTGTWNTQLEPNTCYTGAIPDSPPDPVQNVTHAVSFNVSADDFNDFFFVYDNQETSSIDEEAVRVEIVNLLLFTSHLIRVCFGLEFSFLVCFMPTFTIDLAKINFCSNSKLFPTKISST